MVEDGMRELWRAVVDRAVLDARGSHLLGENPDFARESVVEWVDSDDFDHVCGMAGLDPTETRTMMRRELGATV